MNRRVVVVVVTTLSLSQYLLAVLVILIASPKSSWSSCAFVPTTRTTTTTAKTTTATTTHYPTAVGREANRLVSLQGAESEVSFAENLDGSKVRIGILRTRWNEVHVNNLVQGIRQALADCKVPPESIFETSVPGSYELPLAARFLALSGTVDAIICTGVLIKGDTLHFEFIADAVSKGIMNVGVQTSTPCIFGVLTCLDEDQVKARSTANNNHGYDWGKTAVEMALLRIEALGQATKATTSLGAMGFGIAAAAAAAQEKEKGGRGGFF